MDFSNKFKEGINKFASEIGLKGKEAKAEFVDLVCSSMETAIKAGARMEETDLEKSASEDTSLDRYITKRAEQEKLEKSAVIRQESCTDSEGNEGSWVLYDSDGNKQLGCHTSRESAEAQERAIQANK